MITTRVWHLRHAWRTWRQNDKTTQCRKSTAIVTDMSLSGSIPDLDKFVYSVYTKLAAVELDISKLKNLHDPPPRRSVGNAHGRSIL